MAVPPGGFPPTSRNPFLPPSVSSLRVTFSKGGLLKGRASDSGLDRRKKVKRKVVLSKYVPGSVMNDGSGGRGVGDVVELPRPIVQGRARSGEVQGPLSPIRAKAVLPCLSFAEVVAQSRAKIDPVVECASFCGSLATQTGNKDGFPAVCFSSEAFQSGVYKFRFAMVMKFRHSRPSMKSLQHLIYAKWGIQGRYSFSEFWDSFHVIIVLESEADVQKGLRCRFRKVGSCDFKLFRWFPDYDPLKSLSSSRQWISLPRVPLFLFDKAFAEIIVSSFAKLIRVDADSELCRNLSRMRLCVVLREGVMVPEKVWVQLPDGHSYWQIIEVEVPQSQTRKEDERKAKCVAECHTEVRNSGESHSKSKSVVEGHKDIENSGRDQGHNGVQTEHQNGGPVEATNQWQLVSHSKKKKKRVATSSKDTIQMGNAEMGSPSVCDNSDVNTVSGKRLIISAEEGSKRIPLEQISGHYGRAGSGSFGSPLDIVPVRTSENEACHADGLEEAAAEGQNNGSYAVKSLSNAENRNIEPSIGTHASINVGQCNRLDFSFGPSQMVIANDSSKKKMVPPGNKRSNHVTSTAMTKDSLDMALGSTIGCVTNKSITHVTPSNALGSTISNGVSNVVASPSQKKKIVSSNNKRPSVINADGDGLDQEGSRRVASPDGTHGENLNNVEMNEISKMINDDGDVTMQVAPHVSPSTISPSTKKPNGHVTLRMAHSKVGFELEVGSTCPNGVSNNAKDSDGLAGCDGSDRLGGILDLPDCQLNFAKEGSTSPYTPSSHLDNHAGSSIVTQTVPCDSLELLRKKGGLHKMAYEPNKANVLVLPTEDVAPKLDSYGSTIFPFRRDDHSGVDYLDAKGFYLHL